MVLVFIKSLFLSHIILVLTTGGGIGGGAFRSTWVIMLDTAGNGKFDKGFVGLNK